jgi:hypothetical protein
LPGTAYAPARLRFGCKYRTGCAKPPAQAKKLTWYKQESKMPKVLVPYYSSYGHIGQMAEAVAAGARETGATEDVKRVPETAPEDVARAAYLNLEQAAPVASVTDLENLTPSSSARRRAAASCSLGCSANSIGTD